MATALADMGADAEEILQKADFPQRASFLDHYENWLDGILAIGS